MPLELLSVVSRIHLGAEGPTLHRALLLTWYDELLLHELDDVSFSI
jgi:hypothetical protein